MMKELLFTHFARYPQMEPTDAVKLLYQSVFGGGHLIPDPMQSLAYLEKERNGLKPNPEIPFYEEIGSGLVRLNLAAPTCFALSAEEINEKFVVSAAHILSLHRTKNDLEAALSVLTAVTADGNAPFSADALQAYLTDYRAAGCPMVSHSEAYRAAYHPSYRVIEKKLLQ